jgi:hypothetical protein
MGEDGGGGKGNCTAQILGYVFWINALAIIGNQLLTRGFWGWLG